MTTNGGGSWKAVATTTDQGSFNASKCVGTGANAVCTVGGKDTTTSLPLLYITTNGGSSWKSVALTTKHGVVNAAG